jgi:divalent metal cation (Fe/Co/Zn/Cd) transporter
MTRSAAGSRSTHRTVLVAGAANVVVAAAKLAAGLMTGSSAMLAETAHSVADTLNQELLIGKAAEPRDLELIRNEIEHTPGVDTLLELLTMHLGPDHLIVAGRVALDDEVSADRVEDLADDIDRRLAEKLPVIPHVFIDPTQTSPGRGPAAR